MANNVARYPRFIKLLFIDFWFSVHSLIARRVREDCVYCEDSWLI